MMGCLRLDVSRFNALRDFFFSFFFVGVYMKNFNNFFFFILFGKSERWCKKILNSFHLFSNEIHLILDAFFFFSYRRIFFQSSLYVEIAKHLKLRILSANKFHF